jgi:hypothetical protein
MALASRAACGYHFAVNYGRWCVTSFRDPIQRLISLYNLFKFDVKLSEEELGTERFCAVALATETVRTARPMTK